MLRILDPFAIQYTSTVPDMIDTIIAALSYSLMRKCNDEFYYVERVVGTAKPFSDEYVFAISIHVGTR